MTTKRKTILATLAKSGPTILDDLVDATGWVRKNLQDNLKAIIDEGLGERYKDGVTGLPAYKLSTKGHQWLKNNANSSVTTQAGSGDVTPAAAHCATSLASVSPGKGAAVIEPPTPDKSPAAVRSDDQTALSKTVTEFCEWLGKRKNVPRPPRNLRECQDILRQLLLEVDTFIEQEKTIKQLREQLAYEESKVAVATSAPRNEQLDKQPTRYIVAEEYLALDSEEEANIAALDLAKEIPINTPVIVFTSHKARELRINWRDA